MKKQIFLTALLGILNLNFTFAQSKLASIVVDFYKAVDAGDFTKAASFFAADAKISLPVSPVPLDITAYQQVGMGFKAGFPDYQHKVLEGIETKNVYAFKGWFAGTNTGPMMGNPPTGNRVETPFSGYFKFNEAYQVSELTVIFDLASFNAQVMKGIPTPQEVNKKLALQIMENLHKRNLDGIESSYFAQCKFNGWAPQQLDVNGYKQVMSGLLAAFPDSRFVVEDVVTEGDRVVIRHRFEGTHTGAPFQGVPISKKRAVAAATVTFQFKDGKPVELWLNADFLGLLTQIGGIPSGR